MDIIGSAEHISRQLSRFSRVNLAYFPTPMERLDRIGGELGVELWIKRDDFMPLAFGGNKLRKLEFTLGDAIARESDVIVTTGAVISNHARLTTAAARKVGLDVVLVLRGRDSFPMDVKGNLLLDHLLGADVRVYDIGREEVDRALKEVAGELRNKGRRPYILPTGGATPVGVLGYVNAALELACQMEELGIDVDYVVHSTGTGGTQAGLVLGFRLLDLPVEVLGFSDGTPAGWLEENTLRLARGAEKILGVEGLVRRRDITVVDGYSREGFGVVTGDVVKVMKLFARREALLLDTVYTGKAMFGLISMVEDGKLDRGSRIIFIHTGGTPLIFHLDDIILKEGDL